MSRNDASGSRSHVTTRVSGGVRGLQRQRGQQEDLRGSEETGPAVDAKEGFLSPPSFSLYSVILQPPPFFCLLFNVATVDHSNKLRKAVTVCTSAASRFTASNGTETSVKCFCSDLMFYFKSISTVFNRGCCATSIFMAALNTAVNYSMNGLC